MKSIKFRGKRLDNGEWVYGNYVENTDGHVIHWITEDGAPWWANVDPNTVTQFIGLYDAKFMPIFEGDILNGINDHPNVFTNIVAYDDETAQYTGYRCADDLSIIGDPDVLTCFHQTEWDEHRKRWYLPSAVISGNLWDIQEPPVFESSCLIVDTFDEFRKHFQ